jgi:ADP-heptose:LPS heptosyltransferase
MSPTAVVLRALGLGDLLTGLPALRGLRASLPDHRIVLACPLELGQLARRAGAVDEVINTAALSWSSAVRRRVEVGVNLHGRGPQSHRLLMDLKPGRMLAFVAPQAGVVEGPRWRMQEHEVARWCRMLEWYGIATDTSSLGIEPLESPPCTGATVIHPGAASRARRWPPERYAAVARHERDHGRRVVITGGRAEAALARTVAALSGVPSGDVLAGRTSLEDLIQLVAGAGRVVCGDTGIAHLATALGTPSVVLFGPVSPALWGPPARSDRHRALWRGSTGDPHAQVDGGLLRITVEDVLAELDQMAPLRRYVGADQAAPRPRVGRPSYRRCERST